MKYKDDVIVIGSGIGGLTAATYLSKNGYRVKIFERLNQPGGCVNTFKRGEYYFEGSTHQICGFAHPKYLKKYFIQLGLPFEILQELDDSFEACLYNREGINKRFVIKSGFNNAIKSFVSYFPDQKETVLKVLKKSKRISYDLFRLLRLLRENPLFHIYDAVTGLMMLNGKEGSLIKRLGNASYKGYTEIEKKSLLDFLDFVEDDELKYLFSLYSFYEANSPDKIPSSVIAAMIYLFISNKPIFIKGGTKTLINSMIDTLKKNGSEIVYNANVTGIITENNTAVGVKLEDGSIHKAKYIVSNVNAFTTYNELLKDKNLLTDDFNKKIKNYTSSLSGFQIFLGLPFDLREFGFKCSTTFFTPTININELFINPDITKKSDFYFLLTNYSAMDNSFAKEGKSSVVVFAFENIDNWPERKSNEYKVKKETVQKKFLNKIFEVTKLPVDKAEEVFSATPHTFKHYMGTPKGGFIGAELNFSQGSLNRFNQKSPIKNLMLAGADTIPSGGFSTAFDSGLIAGRYIVTS